MFQNVFEMFSDVEKCPEMLVSAETPEQPANSHPPELRVVNVKLRVIRCSKPVLW